jgi:hypothetical protein
MAKIVTDIAGKVLVALCTGAGALLAKAASEKGVGAAIKMLQEKKESVADAAAAVVETTANVAEGVPTDAVEGVSEVLEKAAEVAEEVSGA